ncbi:MAG: DUF4012 domain-containing protein [Chloroflexota bacterium]
MAVAAALLVAVLGLQTLSAWYLTPLLRAVDVRARAEAMAAEIGDLPIFEIDRQTVAHLRERLNALRGDIGWFRLFVANDPVIQLGQQLGVARDFAANAALLLAAADDVTRAANIALDLADRFVALKERPGVTGETLISDLVELMATSTAQIDEAYALMTEARAKLGGIPIDAQADLRKAADVMSGSLDRYTPLVEQLRSVDGILPGIVGWTDTKRYLVLAQDPAELRPTGGYTGTVGIVAFFDGVLVERSFQDVYHLDLRPGVPFVEPPEPLANHLIGSSSWQLADANWSPDFPTAAQDALTLYTLESGDNDVDGVVGLTTYALDRLLQVTGPIEVPDYAVTVHPGEVTLTALAQTRGISTPTSNRKEFLDDLASRVLDKLFSLPSASWPALYEAFVEIADQRQMLTWFKDPAAQSLVATAPIGGAVRQDAGDYLYVVEANLAPTSKYNLVIDRYDTINVTLAANGDALSELRLDWQNNALAAGEPYASIRSYSTSTSGLYGGYIRVLAPSSSELLSVEGAAIDPVDGAENELIEAGRRSVGNFLLMGPGPANLAYRWTTPAVATETDGIWTYRLTIQKQPGLRAMPVDVVISLPGGATIESVSEGATAGEGTVTVMTSLARDAQIEIRYRAP